VVAGRERVGAEDGEVLALALERGEPAARAKGLAGLEQRAVELVHHRLVVLRVNNPRDLWAARTVQSSVSTGSSSSFPSTLAMVTCRRDSAVTAEAGKRACAAGHGRKVKTRKKWQR